MIAKSPCGASATATVESGSEHLGIGAAAGEPFAGAFSCVSCVTANGDAQSIAATTATTNVHFIRLPRDPGVCDVEIENTRAGKSTRILQLSEGYRTASWFICGCKIMGRER